MAALDFVARPESPTHVFGSRWPRATWLLLAWAIQLAIVWWTSLPHFEDPKLDPDDYRYLHHLQSLDADFSGTFLEASTVENRWDHIWWLEAEEKVRFYRPTVVFSYWLDRALWGDQVKVGLLVTNMLLHGACCLLVAWLLLMLFGAGLPMVLGSALFAGMWCHGEVMWYVAGRTDTLAAVGFLLGLGLHLAGRSRPSLRYAALLAYGFAFLSKELTVALPLICLLCDAWRTPSGTEKPMGWRAALTDHWRLWAGYAVVASVVQGVRSIALSGSSSALVYPYFIAPNRAEFWPHLWTQARNYSENLLLARGTPPFLRFGQLDQNSTWLGLALTLAAIGTTLWWLRRDRRLWWLAILALTTWAPTSFVYISERYLYLPSFAVVGVAVLALTHIQGRAALALRVFASTAALAWVAHQAHALEFKNRRIMVEQPRFAHYVENQIKRDLQALPKGSDVLILNLPGDWLAAQFTGSMLRVMLNDPNLNVRVLTVMPTTGSMGADIVTRAEGEHTLYVEGGAERGGIARAPLLDQGLVKFPWLRLDAGRIVTKPRVGFEVEVVAGDGDRCSIARFTLPKPLRNYVVLRWLPGPQVDPVYGEIPASYRRHRATCRRVKFD